MTCKVDSKSCFPENNKTTINVNVVFRSLISEVLWLDWISSFFSLCQSDLGTPDKNGVFNFWCDFKQETWLSMILENTISQSVKKKNEGSHYDTF